MRPEPTSAEVRATLRRLADEQLVSLAGLSRLIGRSPGYLARFVTRGIPDRLADKDRRLLANFFGVAERELGGRR